EQGLAVIVVPALRARLRVGSEGLVVLSGAAQGGDVLTREHSREGILRVTGVGDLGEGANGLPQVGLLAGLRECAEREGERKVLAIAGRQLPESRRQMDIRVLLDQGEPVPEPAANGVELSPAEGLPGLELLRLRDRKSVV